MLQIRPKAHLSLPFPAGMRIATPVCALVRNDMQKTGTRQRVQGGGTRGKVRRRWQFCLVQRPCLCGHAACFCMSLRGAQRRGNPFSLQHSIAESSTLGEYEKMLQIRPRQHILAHAGTRQVSACRCELRSCNCRNGFPSACHCEERSDVAIRSPCSTASQKAVLWANTKKYYEFAQTAANLPGISAGMRIATPVCALVRNDMQKTGTRQRVQGGASKQTGRRLRVLPLGGRPCKRRHPASLCMSLRGAQRRGNPFSLQYNITESSTLGEYEKMLRIRPNISLFARHFCGDADCHTSVRTGSQ